MESTAATGSCAHCGNAASLQCAHVEPDGSQSCTFYCTKECQTKAWPAHKKACRQSRDRARLFQTGDLLRALILPYCERTGTIDIGSVKVKHDGLHIWDGKRSKQPFGRHGLERFPDLTDTQKEAIITYRGTENAWDLFRWLLRIALEDYKDIQVHALKLNEPIVKITHHQARKHDHDGHPTVYYNHNPPYTPHFIFSVALPDKIRYAIDPFGSWLTPNTLNRPVQPLQPYLDHFAHDYKILPIKTMSPATDDLIFHTYLTGCGLAQIQAAAADKLREKITKPLLTSLVKKPRAEFEAEKTQLVRSVRALINPIFDAGAPGIQRLEEAVIEDAKIWMASVEQGREFLARWEEMKAAGKGMAEDEHRDVECECCKGNMRMVGFVKRARESGREEELGELGHFVGCRGTCERIYERFPRFL